MLSAATILSLPPRVVTRKVGGEIVLLNLSTGTYFGLDPVGSRFLELLERDGRFSAIVDGMLAEYEVAREQLESDLVRLSEEMIAKGLLEARQEV